MLTFAPKRRKRINEQGKLAKFADMERFENVFQYPYSVVDDVPFDMKGKWREMYFHNDNPYRAGVGMRQR